MILADFVEILNNILRFGPIFNRYGWVCLKNKGLPETENLRQFARTSKFWLWSSWTTQTNFQFIFGSSTWNVIIESYFFRNKISDRKKTSRSILTSNIHNLGTKNFNYVICGFVLTNIYFWIFLLCRNEKLFQDSMNDINVTNTQDF